MKKVLILSFLLSFVVSIHALTIDEAVQKGLANNFGLKSQSSVIKSSKYRLKASQAGMMPSLILESSHTKTDRTQKNKISLPSPAVPDISMTQVEQEYTEAMAALKYDIYTGGAVTHDIKSKKLNYNYEKLIFDEKKQKLIYNIRVAFINILKQKSLLKSAKQEVSALKSHMQDVIDLAEEGLVPELDKLHTQVKLRMAQQKVTALKGDLKTAKSHLYSLMGMDSYNDETTIEKIDNIKTLQLNPEELFKMAEKNRPILKALQIKYRSVLQSAQASKSGYKPKVYVMGGYKYSDMNESVEPRDNAFIQAGMSFKLDWTKDFNVVNSLKQKAYSIADTRRDTILQIRTEVKKAFEDMQSALENKDVARTAIKEAKEYYRIMKLKYKNTLATNTDLLDAEAMLTKAREDFTIAFYNYAESIYALEKAVGRPLR
ncbi:MAG: TolC family protein [Flexistipes sinusarabici]|uniref:TolC family protein n=1 Tax=Flexistipes sinusarabici TaxID=2352 RepID=A0A5D0MS93_FLESI|nr:TolC family protein [Flexistipes sinusarabici]TYB34903.1 MAG: TolC family protein [Flexistipes sinusarabici]